MSPLAWRDFARLLSGRRLPAALVHLDALERNVDRLRSTLDDNDKTLRVASKSVRHVGLLRRILERGGDRFQGLMCFSLEEAAFLADEGFDDLLVAYPSVGRDALNALASRVSEGACVRLMADDRDHLEAYAAVAREHGVSFDVMLELDVAYQPAGGLHLGVLRSSLRSAEALAELARVGESMEGVQIAGLMGYEAHVAGLTDDNPFSRALNPMRRALKRLAIPAVAKRRAAAVEALRQAVPSERRAALVVNGGGTGSLESTTREASVSEVTAGSGFLCPHLFDYYKGTTLEPAAFFALEVCRLPEPGTVTCLGGGYVASGEPSWDRLPVPHAPEGLSYVRMEGAGEVQTPLKTGPETPELEVGDVVIFRHAKAGELAERFADYVLVRGQRDSVDVEASEPTYRGQGQTFF